jgi:arylformamidase
MKIYDITRTLQEAPVYPGSPAPQFLRQPGAPGTPDQFLLTADAHAGTHADAFSHFLPGDRSIDAMPLENYCGPCRVLTVPGDRLIRMDDLRGKISGAVRIALRSGGSAFLCEEAAEYIAACGVKAVVTDALSIAPPDNEATVHSILMRGGVAIIENATFEAVADGDYLLFAFPMKLGGADGAPVRAVLLGPGK